MKLLHQHQLVQFIEIAINEFIQTYHQKGSDFLMAPLNISLNFNYKFMMANNYGK